jgi:TolB-like protein
VVEDIITTLSRIPSLLVIPRNGRGDARQSAKVNKLSGDANAQYDIYRYMRFRPHAA